jgi:regulator of RNase E activity RraA
MVERRAQGQVAMTTGPLTNGIIEQLKLLDSCTVANAVEKFDVRLRNAGFVDSRVRCMFEEFPPLAGYAATARVRTSIPPMEGPSYLDSTGWLDSILKVPPPRVIVLQDVDRHPGLGALVGEVHAGILMALNSIGLITNGAVRDLPGVRKMGFQCFAGNVTVSHAYAHVLEFGIPVEIGGLRISPGDLMHGDRHGVLKIPIEIAPEIPPVARKLMEADERIMNACRAPDFSLEKLRRLLQEMNLRPDATGPAHKGK